jgi:hypothetical protein
MGTSTKAICVSLEIPDLLSIKKFCPYLVKEILEFNAMTVCACCSVAFEWAFFIHLVRGIGLTSVLLEYLNGKKLMYIYSH